MGKYLIPKPETRYWFNNDPIRTFHVNVLTSGIPYGERFFAMSVVPYLKKIQCPVLKKEMIRFVREEMNHSKAHYRLYLKAVKPFYPTLKVRDCFHQKVFMLIGFLLGGKIRLSVVAAMEHFTAVSCQNYLHHPELMEGMDPKIRAIWVWHFKEEIGHKSVAYDIFTAASNRYVVRVLGFVIAGLFMISGYVSGVFQMAAHDKLYKKLSFYKAYYNFLFAKHSHFRKLWRAYFTYLRYHFHPNQ
jgi:predicted metal-dependent hydrolase